MEEYSDFLDMPVLLVFDYANARRLSQLLFSFHEIVRSTFAIIVSCLIHSTHCFRVRRLAGFGILRNPLCLVYIRLVASKGVGFEHGTEGSCPGSSMHHSIFLPRMSYLSNFFLDPSAVCERSRFMNSLMMVVVDL